MGALSGVAGAGDVRRARERPILGNALGCCRRTDQVVGSHCQSGAVPRGGRMRRSRGTTGYIAAVLLESSSCVGTRGKPAGLSYGVRRPKAAVAQEMRLTVRSRNLLPRTTLVSRVAISADLRGLHGPRLTPVTSKGRGPWPMGELHQANISAPAGVNFT